jgi:L-ascorbate metabolism protein UlaG (beta-lactamase superfamily)
MSFELQRWGHSCVRLAADGAIVIDPGSFSQVTQALEGATDVLVTHEHADHVDVGAVAAAAARGVPVHAPRPVVEALLAAGAPVGRLTAVTAGDRFEVAGLQVEVLGEWHEVIHPDLPRFVNVGYLVDSRLLHPGDAYVERRDGGPVDTLLVPVSGPWLRLSEVVDWIRRVRPDHVVGIHDALASPLGRALSSTQIERLCERPVTWLEPGESIRVG